MNSFYISVWTSIITSPTLASTDRYKPLVFRGHLKMFRPLQSPRRRNFIVVIEFAHVKSDRLYLGRYGTFNSYVRTL